MKDNNNAICSICGKPYHMCISCNDVAKLNPWKKHCCSSEHYKVFQVIHGLSTNVYDKKEAKVKLQTIDLSDLGDFRNNIKEIIEEVFTYEEKSVAEEENIEQENIADEVLTEDSNLFTESYVIFTESNVNRKRKTSKVVKTDE